MKKILLPGLLIAAFFFLSNNLNAQVQVMNVVVANPPANSCSNIDLTITGQIWETYPFGSINITGSGQVINIDVVYQSGFIVIPTVTNFTHTASLGTLAPGTYTVNTNGLLGTSQKSTFQLMLTVAAGGPTVDLGPDTLICTTDSITLDATTAGATYLWSDASTAATLVAKAAGNYSVTVTNASSCTAVDTVVVTTNNCSTGIIEKQSIQELSVFPNPIKNMINVDIPAEIMNQEVEVSLRSITGSLVFNNRIKLEESTIQLYLPELDNGIYLFELNSNGMRYQNKLTVANK